MCLLTRSRTSLGDTVRQGTSVYLVLFVTGSGGIGRSTRMPPIREKWMPSPHYSSSRGPYNKAVFHTTQGAMTIEALGNWFANPSAQCSSHHGADQYSSGLFGAYVYESNKAWTQGNANPYCLSIELCAYAEWSRSTWLGKPILIDNAAEWLRYIVDKYSIPWTILSSSQAQDPNVRGICQHRDFGSWGSGHSDAGNGFPLDVVIDKAKKWGGGGAAPSEGGRIGEMASSAFDSAGRRWCVMVREDGKVCVLPPGWEDFTPIDPSQSGAYPGASITYVRDSDRLVVSYINGDRRFGSYERLAADGSPWGGWRLMGNAKAKV